MTTLTILTDQASALIRAEVRAGDERTKLDAAIRQVANMGVSVSEISAATGMTLEQVRRVLDRPAEFDELAVLSGAAA